MFAFPYHSDRLYRLEAKLITQDGGCIRSLPINFQLEKNERFPATDQKSYFAVYFILIKRKISQTFSSNW